MEKSLDRAKNLSTVQKEACLQRISLTTDLAKLATVDLLVEAVSENEEVLAPFGSTDVEG